MQIEFLTVIYGCWTVIHTLEDSSKGIPRVGDTISGIPHRVDSKYRVSRAIVIRVDWDYSEGTIKIYIE